MLTYEHIQAIVESIDLTIDVSSVSNVGTTWTLNTSNTKWATIGKKIDNYVITAFVQNESVTVVTTDTLTAGTYSLGEINFIYSTFVEANQTLGFKANSLDKLPMIYLHMNTPEDYENDLSAIDYESDVYLLFMVDNDYKKWLTNDHFTYAIKPMRALLNTFISKLKAYTYSVDLLENYTITDYANFGVYEEKKGMTRAIFNDNISGSELPIRIKFLKSTLCQN